MEDLLGLHRAVVEGVDVVGDGTVVVSVRPKARERDRSPHCVVEAGLLLRQGRTSRVERGR